MKDVTAGVAKRSSKSSVELLVDMIPTHWREWISD
jgi:hypothetical protein